MWSKGLAKSSAIRIKKQMKFLNAKPSRTGYTVKTPLKTNIAYFVEQTISDIMYFHRHSCENYLNYSTGTKYQTQKRSSYLARTNKLATKHIQPKGILNYIPYFLNRLS